jgi:hypothetical protein
MPLPSNTVKEAMQSVSDAELLDVVRRLRQYLVTLDNCQFMSDQLSKIDDETVRNNISALVPGMTETSQKVNTLLKSIETSKPYRNMTRHFNLGEE